MYTVLVTFINEIILIVHLLKFDILSLECAMATIRWEVGYSNR